MANPYSLTFGKEPLQVISRMAQMDEIIESFVADQPLQQIYMITGVRGSGKTVFMTEVAKDIEKRKDWIVISLNPEKDLLEGLAAKLTSEISISSIIKNAKINLSVFGFGAEISGVAPINDIEVAIEKILENLNKHGKRILITIDEVTNTQSMRVFSSAFQIFIRKDLPLFLLMTGLYENIDDLQNEKSLTFLYRAPKMILSPLNMGSMADNYEKNVKVERNKAVEMAKMTRGYSFAFQVLGYYACEMDDDKKVYSSFKQRLEEYVYEKIWSELSGNDKSVLFAIANSNEGKISAVREILNMDTNHFNPYRKRLIRKGVINGDERGYVKFTLPLFEEFVKENYSQY